MTTKTKKKPLAMRKSAPGTKANTASTFTPNASQIDILKAVQEHRQPDVTVNYSRRTHKADCKKLIQKGLMSQTSRGWKLSAAGQLELKLNEMEAKHRQPLETVSPRKSPKATKKQKAFALNFTHTMMESAIESDCYPDALTYARQIWRASDCQGNLTFKLKHTGTSVQEAVAWLESFNRIQVKKDSTSLYFVLSA